MLRNLNCLFFALSLLMLSCAKTPVKKRRNPKKSYDQGVEDEFSKIENDQRDVLEYYRRLRLQNWENYKKKFTRPPRKREPKPKAQSYRPAPIAKEKRRVSPPKPERTSLPQPQIDEMKIEVRQHMDYFCMQVRKSNRFSDTADCLAFTEDVYNRCMAKNPILYNRNLVKCIRGKLH